MRLILNQKNKKSALHEVEGVSDIEIVSKSSVEKINRFRRKQPSPEELIESIKSGDKVALSRAITLIESTNADHADKASQVINGCLPYANNSIRIGITGVPGVGKSTFIEAFGKHLTLQGKKVAVLAIDPSSSISHGSILGDKTRMEELVKDENAYIRPTPSGDTLGGVARKTRESIILCEACGFDVIIIETVGVGQSETMVHSMVDFFLLLKLSGAGDELQGIKRGIMEMADAIVINKADGDNIRKAKLAKTEFQRALHLFPPKKSGWSPKVMTCSSYTKEGVLEIWDLIGEYVTLTQSNGYFQGKRQEQNQFWFLETIESQLKLWFYNDENVKLSLEEYKKQVESNQISPFTAALELLSKFK